MCDLETTPREGFSSKLGVAAAAAAGSAVGLGKKWGQAKKNHPTETIGDRPECH